jgi:hypothetical protein
MKLYQVVFKNYFTLSHMTDSENGEKTFCGKNWRDNPCNETSKLPQNVDVEQYVGCKVCLKAYLKKLKKEGA